MKKQVSGVLLSAAVVLMLISMMTISAAGVVPTPAARSSASLTDGCTPAAGVSLGSFASGYEACEAGTVDGLPAGIGGITFKYDDPSKLLLIAGADTPAAEIYAIPVTRDAGNHITVPGGGAFFASAQSGAGGLAYGPGNVLFYSRPYFDEDLQLHNEVGEIKPGSAQTDKTVDLAPLGVSKKISGLNFVPEGYPHPGELKVVSYETGAWYSATLSPDEGGTYSIATISTKTGVSPYSRAFVFVPPSSPQLRDYSFVLVGEYFDGRVSVYPLNPEGNPMDDGRADFLTGLPWIESMTFDPLTNDLIIATYTRRVVAVRGFGTQPWQPSPTPTSTSTTTPTPTPTFTPTPTATSTPPPKSRITGRVITADGQPLREATVDLVGVYRGMTDSGGYYYFSQLPPGTYTLKPSKVYYSFWPSTRTVTVPPDATVPDFVASKAVSHPPVILVHGYLGASGPSDECEYGVDHYDQARFRLFDDLPQWLVNDGFDVWIAHWDSAPVPGTTWTVESNGACLAKEIATVKQQTGSNSVILIAHSMGGVVSRAYLQSSTYFARRDVDMLITHGSPHGGIAGLNLLWMITDGALGLYCVLQPAFCQMDPDYMRIFNGRLESSVVPYYTIGADGGSWLGNILYPLNGPNDGLVSLASGTGKYFSWFGNSAALKRPVTRYKTHENHLNDWGTWYFEPRPGQTWSDSYKCVREILLGLNRTDCVAAPASPARPEELGAQVGPVQPEAAQAEAPEAEAPVAEAPPYAYAPLQKGHISTGQTIAATVSVDTTGQSTFALSWKAGTVSLSLVDPNGLLIDPAYALANPSVVTFDTGPAVGASPGWMTYTFPTTVSGSWTLNITAPDAGAAGTDWMTVTTFESGRTLGVGADAERYRIGDTATLTASLKNGTTGIAGATVDVDLIRPDGVTDKLTLTGMGGGEYQGTYTIPNTPGYLDVKFTAHGSDGGTEFSREAHQIVSIMPQTGTLTGSYADRAVNERGDIRPDALQVDVGINLSKAGDYNLTADLEAGGQVVAQSSMVLNVAAAGVQTAPLRFDGGHIVAAKLDGPYKLTNLVLVDLQSAVPAIMQSDLYTTAMYRYAQFDPGNSQMLYLPMIRR